MKPIKLNLFLFLFLLFVCPALYAAVHTSTSCDRGAVQYAVNAASDGDTVQIPAGSATWSSSVNITSKALTLRGSGIGPSGTIITNANGNNAVNISGGKTFRVTGIYFIGTGNTNSTSIYVASGNYYGFRVDNCKFFNERHAVHLYKIYAEGLIDHCTYYCKENKGSGDHVAIYVYGLGDSTDWNRPLLMGTSSAVFVEDCFFEYFAPSNSDRPYMASRSGTRIVFRNSFGRNGCFELFGPDSAYNRRGVVSFEAYDNYFTGSCYTLFTIKGGTGNIFNNVIVTTGSLGTNLELTDYRSQGSDYHPFGKCNGMNSFDGNQPFDASATGNHTGGSNASVLTCSGKTWATNQWAGYALWNETDNSVGRIISNTATTITTGGMTEGYTILSSGTATAASATIMTTVGTNWSWSAYKDFFYIYNVTDGSYGKITGNSPTTITTSGGLSGGTANAWRIGDVFQVTHDIPSAGIEKDWDSGDSFKITNGWPCLDQVGRSRDADNNNIQLQVSNPLYEWNNTLNGSDLDPGVNGGGPSPISVADHIKDGRDYYSDTQRPGYVPYPYPHALIAFWEGVVDTSSPTAPSAVYDGTGADVSATFSTTSLSANWTAGTDSESGISGYRFAVGTTAGGTNTRGWATITSASTETYVNVNVGTTYYFTVKSINGIGLVSQTATNSNGQYVTTDGTPPSAPGLVRDGTGSVDISTTISTTQLSANWTAGVDAESGISGYQYAIGTTAGGTNTLGWQSPGNVTSITRGSLSLSVGSTYYFTVRAVNGSNLTGAAANSNGVVVVSTADVTPPVMGAVRDGSGADINSTMALDRLSANWDPGTDTESGITGYQYAIGTTAGGINTSGWTTVGNTSFAVTKSSLTLSPGTTYYFTVRAINGNNLTGTAANSNGQYVVAIDTSDITAPPNITQVRDGTGADESATTSTTQLSANWDAVVDPESGVARYWYAVGTTAGATDTRAWTDNGQTTMIQVSGFSLTVGVTYYITVKAENNVGLQSTPANSNGQVVVVPVPPDTTAPSISGVSAQSITSNGATIAWTTDENSTSQVEYGRTTIYGTLTIEDALPVTSHSAVITGLIAGSEYHYRVISKDASNNETISADYTFTTLSAAGTISEAIHAYPNPCKISALNPAKFRIPNSGTGGEVGIYTVSGRLIRKLAGGAEITWDGTNTDGERIGRGIYIYKITSSSGDSVTGKLALTK